MIYLYNTLKRQEEPFHPLEEGVVKMYHCGPTVYARPHIGNYRAFLFADLLRRFFEYKGYSVLQVMNLTDVDDKTIRDSQKEGIPLREFTDRYIQIFFEELDLLRIQRAHHYPRATDHIPQMVELVKKLGEKGHTYQSQGSTYYRVSSFPRYGCLSHIDMSGLQAGKRVDADEYDKDSPQDFALWKSWSERDGEVFWETELGKGRPGWHLECSAMSMEYLGESFDIHTGGVDLIFPHHENEIAQSEGATGRPFVRYWLHNEHFLLDGQKISKSEGNVIYLPDILDLGFQGEHIRYVLLSSHYRTRFSFHMPKSLEDAREALQRLRNFRLFLAEQTRPGEVREAFQKALEAAQEGFDTALCHDLNTPQALGALFRFVSEVYKIEPNAQEAHLALQFLSKADSVLDVIGEPEKESLEDEEILKLIEERSLARKAKDYAKADRIRDYLKEKGIILEDTAEGTRWRRV